MPPFLRRSLLIGLLLAAACEEEAPAPATCQTDEQCAALDADGDRCNGGFVCNEGVCEETPDPITCVSEGPCVIAACVPETGACESTPRDDGVGCDDANPCTLDTVCTGGQCGDGRSACDDQAGPCEVASCDPISGECALTPRPDFTDCDDGNDCTSSDLCVTGQCKGQTIKCPDDGDPCTVSACVPGEGCVTSQAPTGAPCDDGDPCTAGDRCQEGTCEPIESACAHLEAPCRDVVCEPTTGACSASPSADGAPCDDGKPCTAHDSCLAGACIVSQPKCEDPGTPCLEATCVAGTGECVYPAVPDVPCDDGDGCTVGDTCTGLGTCAGAVKECPADGDACTTATCTAGVCGQKAQPPGTLCNDGDHCTIGDFCGADGCQGEPACPDDGKPCTAQTCDPADGSCTSAVVPAGTPCEDTNPCTLTGACQGTACVAGPPVICSDDGDPCTLDVCTSQGGCQHLKAPGGASCDDGEPCTAGDRCQGGECVPTAATVCEDDGSPCTTETCVAGEGCASTPIADETPCDDGDPCTQDAVCDAGECVGAPVECLPSAPCRAASCKPGVGCVETVVANGLSCDDGNACTSGTTCNAGVCGGGSALTCPGSGDPCLIGVCDPTTGACGIGPAPAGKPCDDSDPCTVQDGCASGECVGAPFDCGLPSDPCTTLTCVSELAACVASPKPDGAECDAENPCTSAGVCVEGQCTSQPVVECPAPADPCQVALCDPSTGGCTTAPAGNGAACDHADPCLVSGVCQEGTCVGGTPLACPDDGDSCTNEVCVPGEGCSFTADADGSPCTDGDPCTEDTTCAGGACAGGVTLACPADGLPCTSDACVPGVGCFYPPEADGVACDDGDACTGGDVCLAGGCVGDPEVTCPTPADPCLAAACNAATGDCSVVPQPNGTACDDGSLCTAADTCQAGTCVGSAIDCAQDDDPCTVAQCDPGKGACVQVPAFSGTPCDDDNPCTTADACNGAGGCGGAPVACPDPGGVCQVATCDPATGGCVTGKTPNGSPCDDGNPCATGDLCLQGACLAGPIPTCPPDGPCQLATCDPADGSCSQAPRPDGTACDDGDACSTGESCLSGQCAGGAPLPCEDDSGCAVAACDSDSGECVITPLAPGTACDDGDACTTSDACSAGNCAGAPVSCPASGDPCLVNSCQAGSGECALVALGDGAPCDDGDACSQADQCVGGACAGDPVQCPPSGDDCQANVCQPELGCVLEDANEGHPCASNVCALNTVCVAGQCSGGEPLACPGGGPCREPTCSQLTGCTTKAAGDGTTCDDGEPCTTADACEAGACGGDAVACLEPAPCQVAFCEPGLGCTTAPAPDGAGCSDGNPCTLGDSCQAGACVAGPPKTCGGTACRPEVCSLVTGLCVTTNAPDGKPCDDGNPCTTATACDAGTCAGAPVTCEQPPDPCKVALCSAFAGGCAVFPRPDGTACSDGSLCTAGDRCRSGACEGRPTVTCPAPDGCLVYRCRPKTGQCQPDLATDGELCTDGDPCTAGETCQAGLCEGGAPAGACCAAAGDCDDGSPCTVDSCLDGRCRHSLADLSACLGRIVVAGRDDGELSLIDARTLAPLGSLVAGGTSDLAASADAQLIFAVAPDQPLLALDPYVPEATPAAPASLGGRWLRAQDGPARLAVVHAGGAVETFDAISGTFLSAGPVVHPAAGAPALDPETSRLYVPSTFGLLAVVDLTAPLSEPPGTPWPVTGQPTRAAYDPVSARVFLVDPAKGGLRVVGAQHGAPVAAPALGGFGAPAALAVDLDRRRLYAAFPADAVVRLFDLDTLAPATPPAVAISPGPVALHVDPLTGRLLVATDLPTALHVLDGDTLEPVVGSPVVVAAGAVAVTTLWSRPGAAVITEVQPAPAAVDDADGEWIEVHNPGSDPIDVSGWTLSTDFEDSTLPGLPPIAPGGYVTLCRNESVEANGGVPCDGALALALPDDALNLYLRRPGGAEVDHAAVVPTGGPGHTMALRHPGYPNARAWSWTPSAGTPAGPNDDVAD